MIEFKINTAGSEIIFSHLTECKNNFIPHLDNTVNILDYSRKLYENAVQFEAWDKQILAGLIGAYINDVNSHSAYISNVSVLPEYSGKGISSVLLDKCIEYTRGKKFAEINLEVYPDNYKAISLYKKKSFIITGTNSETGFILMKLVL